MDSNQLINLNQRIQSLLIEALQIPAEQATSDLQFGDLPQWDSMGHMEVMIYLENEFGIEINPETISNLTSFSTIRQYLQDHGHV